MNEARHSTKGENPATKRPCRICGHTEYSLFAVKNGFHLERCGRCSLVQVTDDLSTVCLADYYKEDFFTDTYSWQHEPKGQRLMYEKANYRLGEIEKFKPGKGTLLEVGCSFGFFLDAARTRGWTTVGVELGEYAARYAQEQLGLEVHCGMVRGCKLPFGQFDVVALWDVIEHLDDPVAELNHMHALLKSEGLLVFNTPDVDGYVRRLQGLRWRCFIPPIHLTNFGPRSMEALLEKTQFRILLRTVALPREALLQKLRLFWLLKKLQFSDKMLVFAQKPVAPT